MSDSHRYSDYSRTRVPRKKRTMPVYGEGLDSGKYYRCWNCGYVCNIERDSLDTGELGGDGISYLTTTSTYGPILSVNDVLGYFVLDGIFTLETNEMIYPDVNGGCPFCGTKNWK